ncbi:hypothetical protein IWW48_002345 [Coemansia sp. RSA 1200]|nr:hypothetical protein IWW48_002345 [Coemansia sp. RSA 1200]
MTTSRGLQADISSIHHTEEEEEEETITAVGEGYHESADLVNKFLDYYSTTTTTTTTISADTIKAAAVTDTPRPKELFASATRATSTSTESTAVSVSQQMRPGKGTTGSSGQSTDTEAAGGNSGSSSRSSESSMGDSAAAAARVLAALQDRTGIATSSGGGAGAGGTASASAAEAGPTLWQPIQTPAAKIQSSTSTPRQNHSAFDASAREGSAPLPGSFDSNMHRRPDMGFLALLNSAAAYVAESSSSAAAAATTATAATVPQENSAHNYRGSISHDGGNRQQGASDNINGSSSSSAAYLEHSELLADNSLTLSGINNGFVGHVAGGSRNGQTSTATGTNATAGFASAHYDPSLSNAAAYRDLAQALQHIAATTSGTNSALMASGIETQQQQQHLFGSNAEHAPNHIGHGLTASAIRQDGLLPQANQFSTHPRHGTAKSGSVATPLGSTSASKRKRKDGSSNSTPMHTPAKRKTSHASDHQANLSVSANSAEVRRAARKWSEEETENLLQGCSKYGVGAWKKILDDPSFTFNSRTSVDLKDRFRTIRAQECAHSPHHKRSNRKHHAKEPDVVWPLPPNSQRLQGLHRVQRKPTRNYTNDEDRRLLIGVLRHANHWTKIAADPDLQLSNRPGQSLRDRLRNAFPEVFELFGYVIPKKERADRERYTAATTPGPQTPQSKGSTPKRKAPTGSKRLDGDIPDHIRSKIIGILHERSDSLDPHPIPENDAGSAYDVDVDADADGMASQDEDTAAVAGDDSGLSAMPVGSATPTPSKSRTPKRRATAASVARGVSKAGSAGGKRGVRRASISLDAAVASSSSSADGESESKTKRAGGRRKSTAAQKRGRARSKAATVANEEDRESLAATSGGGGSVLGSAAYEYEAGTGPVGYATTGAQNDGGIHSAPAHHSTHGNGGLHIGGFGGLSSSEQRRSGTISAGTTYAGAQNHRNYLLDSFAPSVFSRSIGAGAAEIMATDHLDALALEGRVASGYSTPNQSTRRRHSVQADINDAMAAAAAMAAAGIDRSGLSSTMGFFSASVAAAAAAAAAAAGLGSSTADDVSGNADTMHLGSTAAAADTFRRMTVDGQINPDAFLFPRLPDDNMAAAAAAAAAVAADMSAQSGSEMAAAAAAAAVATGAQTGGMPAASGSAISVGPHNSLSVSTDLGFKLSTTAEAASSTEPPFSASAAVISGVLDDSRSDLLSGHHRSQLRSAQRLLRANGVADDNSIGLSTMPTDADRVVDFETLTQFSQWFPNLAPSTLGWGLADGGAGHIGSESIDPNMLDAGIGTSAAAMIPGGGHAADYSGAAGGSGLTHARRRSQFDWYGLTPSLAAALDAANTAAAAAEQATVPDATSLASLNPFGIGHGHTHSTAGASYRRPSMPIFPSFAFPPGGDLLGLQSTAPLHRNGVSSSTGGDAGIRGGIDADQSAVYGATSHGENAISEAAAAAAAAAVAAALGDQQRASSATGGARSLSLSTGSEAAAAGGHKRAVAQAPTGAETEAATGSASANNGRRRTMHVPPSLVEGVATANFGSNMLGRAPELPQQQQSSGLGGSTLRALNLHTSQQYLLASERMRPGTGGPYPPRPHSGTLRPADSTRSTRVRRSRTISNQNCDTSGGGRLRVGGGGSGAMQTMLPVVSEAASAQLLQLPTATTAKDGHQSLQHQQHQQQMASVFGSLGLVPTGLGAGAGTSRHTRTLSGTHLPQDVVGALAGESSDFLSSFRLHDEPLELGPPAAAAHPASSQGLQQPAMGGRSRGGGAGRPDVDLEAMTTLSAGCAGSIDFSSTLKPFLWAAAAAGLGDDGLHGSSAAAASVAGETQSLVDLRHDADNAIDLYRPASLTPTSGRRFLSMAGGSGAAGDSTPAAGTANAAAVSPVAPRSAASTPGCREAVEI